MKNNKKSCFVRREERGGALLLVMLSVLVATAILALSLPVAKTAQLSSETASARSLNVYLAESAIARAQWMLLNDMTAFPMRNVSTFSSDNTEDNTIEERIRADGKIHQIDWNGNQIRFKVEDAVTNFNFSGTARQIASVMTEYQKSSTNQSDDTELFEELSDQLADYVDTDATSRLKGLEESGYRSQKIYGYPRNGSAQTVEELLLVPAVQKMVKYDDFGIPTNLRFILTPKLSSSYASLSNSKTSISGADLNYISTLLTMNSSDDAFVDRVNKAVLESRETNASLADILSESDLTQLNSIFSTTESGLYIISVEARSAIYPSIRRLKIAFPVTKGRTTFNPERNFTVINHRFYWFLY